MSNWNTFEKKVGELKVRDKVTVKFEANESIPDIKQLKASCGCTQPIYDAETRILSVTYTAPRFPKHIKGSTQNIKKSITVIYKNGTTDVLYITGTKIR